MNQEPEGPGRHRGWYPTAPHGGTLMTEPGALDLSAGKYLRGIPLGGKGNAGEHMFLAAETQLSAHYRIDTHDSAIDPEIREKHKRFPLAAEVHHGIPVRSARQYFHDLNVLAVRPNTSLGLAMDTQDPLIRLVEQLEV